ncbi:beta-1,4-glucuronyltransferase 1 isoform X2 [Sitophilus oryzae]|uniref:Beta-1,4-glucuronyltransferase 1 n=1 Tax=Sitophilus oryzae TaxID=7048 RepID=A0A6J2YGF1_SITOR|nr:beta-1,4-glucuronyltransferase 1 isoform X2 [Sitophilus oryzae]
MESEEFLKSNIKKGKWRLWNISISILVFLTLYNIFLTVKLMFSTSCTDAPLKPVLNIIQKDLDCQNKNLHHQDDILKKEKERVLNKTLHQNTDNYLKEFHINQKYSLNLDLDLGRSDNKLMYRLYDNIIVGEKYTQLTKAYKTCLAAQTSLEKIASLIESSLYWGGPISVATFAATEKELNLLLLYILYLRKCNLKIREKVNFHLAMIEDKRPKKFFIDEERLQKLECDNPMGVLNHLLRESNKIRVNHWRYKLPYPQNLVRNLARKNCHGKYVFLTDVDIIPSRDMAEKLNQFLDTQKCDGKCAYVVPTYELDERVLFPPNKTDLIRMANKGLARPFHHKVFIYNQYATNFTRWQSYKDPDEKIRISHRVTNFEFLYEPFYIAIDTVPPHDERFVGYGYTRNSQVYEMYVAGYEFFVLSPIFTCHWGLQVKRTRPPWREHQNNQNRKQFDSFKKEIFARYNKDPLHMMSPK